MKHTEVALRRPVTTVVVFVALALIGMIASRLLPLEKFPDIEFPGIFIQVPYAGSTPEEVERLITRPVEEALATLSGVEQMFSTSSEGQSQVFLQFGWDQSMGTKGIEARAKVDGIRHLLPDDVRRIFVFTGSLGDQPVLQLRISSEIFPTATTCWTASSRDASSVLTVFPVWTSTGSIRERFASS